MDTAMVTLSFSVYSNAGVYAVLLGSGVSRAADIPTGWEIVLDLCRRLAAAADEPPPPDPEAWFVSTYGKQLRYDVLLEELGATPAERSAIIRHYIEPTPEDVEAGKKVPTKAHREIAALVKSGHIRLILTTNFDALMETALQDAGVSFQVASSSDQLSGLRPYLHSPCTVIKLHGDYRDIRTLNTALELASYPADTNAYLDRILDDFGLIVVGWSATWDTALRAAIERCPTRRYGWYWMQRGSLTDESKALIERRDAKVVQMADANTFFTQLHGSVEGLARLDAPHPLSTAAAVGSARRYISDPARLVDLHSLLHAEVRDLIPFIMSQSVYPNDVENEYVRRTASFTQRSEAIIGILSTVAAFGQNERTLGLLRICLEALNLTSHQSGRTEFLCLRNLPALLSLYAAGTSAVIMNNLTALYTLLKKTTATDDNERMSPYGGVIACQKVIMPSATRLLRPQNVREFTPEENYVFDALRPQLSEYLAFNSSSIEDAFHWFEFLLAATYADSQDSRLLHVGRFLARPNGIKSICSQLTMGGSEKSTWPILNVLFDGNASRLLHILQRLDEYYAPYKGAAVAYTDYWQSFADAYRDATKSWIIA